LNVLCDLLGLLPEAAMPLRYQLLHRTVSAILEAQRYSAKTAALVVHSVSEDKEGFADFSAFLNALGLNDAVSGALVGPVVLHGVSIFAGWIQDEVPKGDRPLAYLDELRGYAARLVEEGDRVRAWCDEQSAKLKRDAAE
jgi:hypothetical protein